MVGRRLVCLVVAACATSGALAPVQAGPVEDVDRAQRRGRDLFSWETFVDHEFGHNHFHVALYDSRNDDYWRRLPGIEGELRATAAWTDTAGATRTRMFSSVERAGYEPFSEGPLCCGFNQGVLVALPPDFGHVDATVDFWASFEDIPQECPPVTEPGPCGGAVEGYHNDNIILLVTNPFGYDAADAYPGGVELF